MKTLSLLVTLITLTAFTGPAMAEPTVPTNPLLGVWSMTTMTPGGGETIDPSQPGLFIFTEAYYSAVYTLGADPRPLSVAAFNPTSDEMVAQHDTIIVNTGTYEASGSTITFRPMVAKSPEFIGGHSTMDFQINGDVLTLTVQSVVAADGVSTAADAPGSSMTLRRIE
ncbi:MAG: lipocalin-like domain-containing protein [Acidobacteria bacterium]|nr:lipocalin-like domain-containing protein [Acidobacteriota bacterium]